MKKKVTVVTANREISSNVTGILRSMFGENVKITMITAPRVFQGERLLTLIESNKHIGPVIITESEFPQETVAKAKENGLFFGTIEKNPTYIKLVNEPTLACANAA